MSENKKISYIPPKPQDGRKRMIGKGQHFLLPLRMQSIYLLVPNEDILSKAASGTLLFSTTSIPTTSVLLVLTLI